MILYISGPMTGYEDFNFPAFHTAAEKLRSAGYEVISPAELEQPDKSWQACMRVDITAMMQAEALVMLPDWQESRGARLEVHIAKELGMPVFDFKDIEVTEYVPAKQQ